MPSTSLGQLAERAVAVEQGADDAQAPAVADAAGGGVEARRCVAGRATHRVVESLAVYSH